VSYVRVSILGATTGGEVWSINPVFDPTGELETGINQASLDAAASAIAALSPGTSSLTLLGTLMSITGARLEVRRDADDSLIAISTQARGAALPGTGSVRLPSQSAAVISLRTDTPGASGRGRLYWPCMGATVAGTGRLNPADVLALMTAQKTYYIAMRDALATAFPTIGFNLAVRSKTTKTTPHVVRLQAGDVVDTQRRRRDKFPESYQQVAFP
jgi:hypothetical protein